VESVPQAFTGRINFLDNKASTDPDEWRADIFIIRNVFWNWTDDAAIDLISTLTKSLRANPNAVLVFADGQSPEDEDGYELSKELIFRRRDLTMMAMHNVKQRTKSEWISLFKTSCPDLELDTRSVSSSHALKIFIEARIRM
jgi:hypothetical protein